MEVLASEFVQGITLIEGSTAQLHRFVNIAFDRVERN
jgi:hypothetical protein